MQCPLGFSCLSLHWQVWKLRSQERLHVFFKTLLCLCQLLQKHQPGSWEADGGGRRGERAVGVLHNKHALEEAQIWMVLTVAPSRTTNCSAPKWECYFIGVTNRRCLLWLRGERSRLTGSRSLEWLLHLTVHNPPDQPPSPAACQWRGVCVQCPTHSAMMMSLLKACPTFLASYCISLFSGMMNDGVSLSWTTCYLGFMESRAVV